MTPETPAVPVKRKKSRKKLIALLVILVIIGGAAGALYAFRRTLTSPSVGTVLPSSPIDTQQSQVELAQFDGTYVSFVHPMTYIEQTAKPVPNELESHLFISSGIVSKVLSLSVAKLPSGNLDDDSSYYMRTQNSAKYKMKSMTVKTEKVVVFTSNDSEGYQQVAFWAHGGKELTLTMTGVASDVPGMTSEFNDMVSSLSWR